MRDLEDEKFAELVRVDERAKREWVGLTEEEAIDLLPVGEWEIEPTLVFAKAIEAKLKEKNT
jgi:hypothetical protein